MKRLSCILGVAVTKSIRAVFFMFRTGKNGDRATLASCTGWVRHRGRFSESKTYAFVLDARLSKGNAEVWLLDQRKQPLCRLDRQSPSRTVALDAKSKYYLRWEFQHASGTCELRW